MVLDEPDRNNFLFKHENKDNQAARRTNSDEQNKHAGRRSCEGVVEADYRSRRTFIIARRNVCPPGKLFRLEASVDPATTAISDPVDLSRRLCSCGFGALWLCSRGVDARSAFLTMNPVAPSAMPKAAAIPARLLRAPRQCSNQGPSSSYVRSSSQARGYHAPTASSASRRLRETTSSQKKNPVFGSSRVSGCVVGYLWNISVRHWG